MNNPFQEQLLKAGLVTKKQVQKAQQDKNKKRKQQKQQSKKAIAVDENKLKLKAQHVAEEKAQRDRELNKKKELQARQKAISIEINQLIENNCLKRDDSCEIVYNFEHNKKVRRIYVDAGMKQQIIKGSLGIARIEGRYELVPKDIAQKIQQRNEKRIVIFDTDESVDQSDPYAEHQIPDDLMW